MAAPPITERQKFWRDHVLAAAPEICVSYVVPSSVGLTKLPLSQIRRLLCELSLPKTDKNRPLELLFCK